MQSLFFNVLVWKNTLILGLFPQTSGCNFFLVITILLCMCWNIYADPTIGINYAKGILLFWHKCWHQVRIKLHRNINLLSLPSNRCLSESALRRRLFNLNNDRITIFGHWAIIEVTADQGWPSILDYRPLTGIFDTLSTPSIYNKFQYTFALKKGTAYQILRDNVCIRTPHEYDS